MEQIRLALKKALSQKLKIRVLLWNVSMFFLFLVLWQHTGRVMAAAGLCLSLAALGTPVIRALSPSKKRIRRELEALLPDPVQRDAFCGSVDAELSQNLLEEFHAPEYRLTLLITRTWLILISASGSLICRRNRVRSAEASFNEVTSHHAVRVSLSDGPDFLCSCEHSYEEIIQIIERTKKGEK